MAKKVEKKALVPELRFPEFREDRTWDCFNGDQLFAQINDRNHNGDLPVLAITQDFGAIPRDLIDYNVSVSESSVNNYKIVRVGDFIISLRSFQGGIEFSNYEGLCSPAYVVLREKRDTSSSFFKHFFKSKIFTRELTKNLEGLRDGKMISYRQFSDVGINLPRKAEQQKIADCLGSLDDLIAAHSAKLAALQDHKKGLLQQLFPAAGETVPKLRFPEFENAGEWKRVNLRSLLREQPRYGVNAAAVPFDEKKATYIRITDISESGRFLSESKASVDVTPSEENSLREGDIVLARTGASVGKSYLYNKDDGALIFAGFLIRIRPHSKKTFPFFISAYLRTDEYWRWVSITSPRGGQPGVNGEEYATMAVPVPPSIEEQRKIADCISSLDALVAAETEQITALKDQKKGLMQRLFPNPELSKE
jgi:type I restriction enzyme S subunit